MEIDYYSAGISIKEDENGKVVGDQPFLIYLKNCIPKKLFVFREKNGARSLRAPKNLIELLSVKKLKPAVISLEFSLFYSAYCSIPH